MDVVDEEGFMACWMALHTGMHTCRKIPVNRMRYWVDQADTTVSVLAELKEAHEGASKGM